MTKKEWLRFEELEEKAKANFMEYSDFNVQKWLETEIERAEYSLLFDKFLLKI